MAAFFLIELSNPHATGWRVAADVLFGVMTIGLVAEAVVAARARIRRRTAARHSP
jgi:hypothetical protein